MTNPVTVIVPVYADWPSLKDCIESLKKHVNIQKHTVVLVNDCGPDADALELNIKEAISGAKGFRYFRNEENLGFVGTCNRAVFELDNSQNDVMLLNSDTKVTSGFLAEMASVLASQKNIGAVSPRSNNATICTIPLAAAPHGGIEPEKSYRLFKKYQSKFPRYSVAPTVHGFCLLIRRDVIKQYGLFDPVFGKGYGEEVDFCRRIQSHGWRCVISNRSYVFHLEGRSFTLEAKRRMIAENNKIIWRRHPDYRQEVIVYMERGIAFEESQFKPHLKPYNRLKNQIKKHPKLRGVARKILGRR